MADEWATILHAGDGPGSLFGALACILGLGSSGWAVQIVAAGWSTPVLSDIVAAATGILAMIVGAAAAALSSLAGTMVSFFFDAISIGEDVKGFSESKSQSAIFLALDTGSGALDVAAFVAGD